MKKVLNSPFAQSTFKTRDSLVGSQRNTRHNFSVRFDIGGETLLLQVLNFSQERAARSVKMGTRVNWSGTVATKYCRKNSLYYTQQLFQQENQKCECLCVGARTHADRRGFVCLDWLGDELENSLARSLKERTQMSVCHKKWQVTHTEEIDVLFAINRSLDTPRIKQIKTNGIRSKN